jgi:hypothetical protein
MMICDQYFSLHVQTFPKINKFQSNKSSFPLFDDLGELYMVSYAIVFSEPLYFLIQLFLNCETLGAVASTRLSSTCLRRNLHDGATCNPHRRASVSLQTRLEKTEAHLVLRPKPRNRHGDFDAQITKPKLPVLRPKPGNPPPPWF